MQHCTINLKGKNPSFVDWQFILFFHSMTYLNFAQPGGTRSDQRKKRKTKLKMGFSMLIYVLKCLNFALHLRSWHANRAQSKLWNVTFLATKKSWWGCFGRYASFQHIYTLGETPSAVASWNKPKMKFCKMCVSKILGTRVETKCPSHHNLTTRIRKRPIARMHPGKSEICKLGTKSVHEYIISVDRAANTLGRKSNFITFHLLQQGILFLLF